MGKILKTLHSGAIDQILPIWLEKKNDFGKIKRCNLRSSAPRCHSGCEVVCLCNYGRNAYGDEK